MIPPTITFNNGVINEILYCFDKHVDDEGYVTDSDNKRVLAMDGKEIKANDIGGIVNVGGETKFIRDDICSLIEATDLLKEQCHSLRGSVD